MPDRISSQLRLRASPPSVPARMVPRRHLTERLNRGSAGPLTLISAGPGSGKTLTVAAWLARGGFAGPVGWLTLDGNDNDPRTFWADVLAALAIGNVPIDPSLSGLAFAGRFGPREVLRVRAGLADLPGPSLLVLDDFQQVSSPAVLESLNTVIDQQSSHLRLLLITRSDPGVHLHRIRVSGELTEIRSGDLRFTQEEAADLFRLDDLVLSDGQLRMLVDRTQGWPVGLRLAALALSSTDDIADGIARFNGTDKSVAEYLVVEVLDRLPASTRDFLLKTSIVERLSPALGTALTGRDDSRAILEAVVAANAFMVSLPGRDVWFRLHPLLRDLLQHQLAVKQPGVTDDLHLLAARWFAEQGESLLAVRHATLARDWDEVGRLLTSSALPLVLTPTGPALADTLEPAATRATQVPTLSTLLASGVRHFQRRDYEGMHQDGQDAAQYLDGAPDALRIPAQVLLATMRTTYARITASGSLVEAATALLDLLKTAPRHLLPAVPQYRAIGLSNVGIGLLWRGELAAARTGLAVAAGHTRELGLPLSELSVQSHLSLLDAIDGHIRRAEQRIADAQQTVDRHGWAEEPHVLGLYAARAMSRVSRNDLDGAADVVAAGLAASTSTSDTSCRLAVGIAAVSIAVGRGDAVAVERAATRLTEEREQVPDLPDLLARWCTVAQAYAPLIGGDPAAVLRMIETPVDTTGFAATIERIVLAKAYLALRKPQVASRLLEPLRRSDVSFRVFAVETRVLLALAAEREKRDNAALTLMTEAIELAQPEGIRQPFLDAGPAAAALIVRHRHVESRHLDFTEQLIPDQRVADTGQSELVVPEHLTERELIVLQYLSTMLKAGEIADDLYITVNTVKSHQRTIYRKLDVTTRRDAVERGRALNLI